MEFAFFFPIVFILYWFVFNKNLKLQNLFLLIVSYIFYGWWDWRFLILIIFSTIVDYIIGYKLNSEDNEKKRKLLLVISLTTNLGLLGFFKYFNFFINSFIGAFTIFGFHMESRNLNIILPVGISFYTFQTLSYTIDIYRKKMKATSEFIDFAAFVTFFPQLVAGPIERASHLLPQFQKDRHFYYDEAVYGLKLILWGLFKKIVIADRVAIVVNNVYSNPKEFQGLALIIATVFFAFQIYCDFSGYSDIAIGTSKILGFDLMENFKRPYFSKSIAEFWKRWHISLSTWFKDYLYIPLGGNRVSKMRWRLNLMLTFLVSGLWHGANWTFIIWGALNGFYQVFGIWSSDFRKNVKNKIGLSSLENLDSILQVITTFSLTCFAWIFFRANNVSDAFYISGNLLSGIDNWNQLSYIKETILSLGLGYKNFIVAIVAIVLMELIHIQQKNTKFKDVMTNKPFVLRWGVYYLMVLVIIFFGYFGESQFIYFQF